MQIHISADDTASASLSHLEPILQRLAASFDKVASTAATSGAAMDGGSKKVAAVGEAAAAAEGKLGRTVNTLERLTEHGKNLQSVLSVVPGAMGEAAGAVADGAESMGTALKGLQASMGPLLAVTAAIAGVVAAVSFFKDSIGDAAKLQESFAVLGATVTAQGGNWATAKDGVDKFATSLEKTTTYSRG
ncbi:MAG: hypothetical protein ACREM8_10795, partial [Vulcanimicrobiaceae bacterium]